MSSKKWVIIHGHFYQPPRENPWLNIIEKQESAAPSPNWNERIYRECYRPNGYSRILDRDGMITGIHNNYRIMSFNFGPTLVSWLHDNHPVSLRRIIEGDRYSTSRFLGHGNAIAQVYNHLIMPLASERDQLTQIRWAKASFKDTYGRKPEGIWLAETAVNMQTITFLIKEKLKFVILAPQQADAIRRLHRSSSWIPTSKTAIDTRRPYRLYARDSAGSKTGGHIDIFFFDEQLSREISFNDLLQDAHILGNRIATCYSQDSKHDEVVIIATDGETFGHHKAFGDMCLAYFFSNVAPELGIQPINFGYYRKLHPPEYEVRLKNAFGEGTAWSCAHDVGRWIRDCGCQTGGEPGWNQRWRGPLRSALEQLQQTVNTHFETVCNNYNVDPWKLRDRYGSMIGNRSEKKWHAFTAKHISQSLSEDQSRQFRRLLEAQKYMLYSFTSCGWFFADISGIEPMQNLAFACRALQLGCPPLQQKKIVRRFIQALSKAKSNYANVTGATLFEKNIYPSHSHERMISFAAAMEITLGIQQRSILKQYGYHYTASRVYHSQQKSNQKGIQWYTILLEHSATGERSKWLVAIDLSNSDVPLGWTIPVTDDILKNIPDKLPSNYPKAQYYSLKDIFYTLQEHIASIYLQKIAGHSEKRFNAWLHSNEQELLLLQSFYQTIPEYFRAPLFFILQQKWNTVFKKFDTSEWRKNELTTLTSIKNRADHYKMALDLKKSADYCEKYLIQEFEKLKQSLDSTYCERISYLMSIVDRFSLPISKHRLEDIFYPILCGPVNTLYEELTSNQPSDTSKIDEHKRELIDKILKFAHRMNFNTTRYPLP